jgi:hypothetical protein
MGLKLSQLASKVASITLVFDEGDLNLEYYPNLITDELVLGWQEAQKRGSDHVDEYIESNNETFLKFIKSWDLLEDDGETVIPLNIEDIKRVSSVIKNQIFQAVIEEMQSPEVGKPRIKRR